MKKSNITSTGSHPARWLWPGTGPVWSNCFNVPGTPTAGVHRGKIHILAVPIMEMTFIIFIGPTRANIQFVLFLLIYLNGQMIAI